MTDLFILRLTHSATINLMTYLQLQCSFIRFDPQPRPSLLPPIADSGELARVWKKVMNTQL